MERCHQMVLVPTSYAPARAPLHLQSAPPSHGQSSSRENASRGTAATWTAGFGWASALIGGIMLRVRTSSTRCQLRARMGWHNRDPMGVRHKETKAQSMKASLFKSVLEEIFMYKELPVRSAVDEEIMLRIEIDDVVFTTRCRAAYVHFRAEGDTLEKRQVMVWLARNKGNIKAALNKRIGRSYGRMPDIHFVESKQEEWDRLFEKARENPEYGYPDPFAPMRGYMPGLQEGVGDEDAPYAHRQGYSVRDYDYDGE
mmetsp:Transcript_32004/g.73054  ORF Transcript_32004/g.73054 Transcript_32004/m.73054 type:complete len:256 (-) Transcript_32004:54-821(-)